MRRSTDHVDTATPTLLLSERQSASANSTKQTDTARRRRDYLLGVFSSTSTIK